MPAKRGQGKLVRKRLLRGPRKGQVVSGYIDKNGKFTEYVPRSKGGAGARKKDTDKTNYADKAPPSSYKAGKGKKKASAGTTNYASGGDREKPSSYKSGDASPRRKGKKSKIKIVGGPKVNKSGNRLHGKTFQTIRKKNGHVVHRYQNKDGSVTDVNMGPAKKKKGKKAKPESVNYASKSKRKKTAAADKNYSKPKKTKTPKPKRVGKAKPSKVNYAAGRKKPRSYARKKRRR